MSDQRTWTVEIWRHEPETRRLWRFFGRTTRAILCHRFAPFKVTLQREINQIANSVVYPPRAWRDLGESIEGVDPITQLGYRYWNDKEFS